MMEGSSFSDPNVIERLGADFVSMRLNVTDEGWPEELPGLALWEKAFAADWRHRYGFATSVVLSPDGKAVFGTSGSGYRWEWDTAINYHPDKYLSWLQGCLDRWRRARGIAADESLSGPERNLRLAALKAEILAQIVEANRRGRKPK